MPLDRHAARLLAMRSVFGGSDAGAPPSPEARRAALTDLAAAAGDPPPEDVVIEALTTSGGRRLRRYTPCGGGEGALLYLHGGGWVAGDLDTHAGVCGALAVASGCSLFALDYRRAPEHPFPAAVEDACETLTWLGDETRRLEFDPARLGIAGDSAGANIATAASVQAARDGTARPALQLLICPILDPLREGGSRRAFGDGYFIEADRLRQDLGDYLGGAGAEDLRIAPLKAPAVMPRTLIHAAEYDPFRDEALDFAQRLRDVGVDVEATVHPGMIHYFYALPKAIPAARAILREIGREAGAALNGL